MWAVHCGLAPEAALEVLDLPCDGQVWRWCSWLGRRVSGSTKYSRGLVARVVGNIVLQKGMETSIDQYAPVFLPGRTSSLTEKPDRPVYRVAKSHTRPKRPCAHKHKTFFIFFFFFACSNAAPVGVEREGDAAAWLAETLVPQSVQEHRLPPWQKLWPYLSLFSSLL